MASEHDVQVANQVIDTIETDGWKIIKTDIEKLLQSLRENLELYRGSDNDRDEFIKGQIQEVKEFLLIEQKYRDILKS